MKFLINTAITFSAILLLSGCGGSSEYDFNTAVPAAEEEPQQGPNFNPQAALAGVPGQIPTTNNLFFGADGTLNIPNASNNPLITQINTLDGFSTSNPVTTEFGLPIDQASLTVGENLHVFKVTTAGPAVTGVVGALTAQQITAVATGENNTTLALVPTAPLDESSTYMVVLTDGITVDGGSPSESSSSYILTKGSTELTGGFAALEPLRQNVNNLEAVADAAGVDKSSVVLSWYFTTQSITPVLESVLATADSATTNLVLADSGLTAQNINPNLSPDVSVYVGTLDIPYYLEAGTEADRSPLLTGYWKSSTGMPPTRFNAAPVNNGNITVPVTMIAPSSAGANIQVAIYQPGITRSRSDVLVYANSLASQGLAVIAIDLPLHGESLTLADGSPNALHASNSAFPTDVEPTFDADLVDNATGAPGPDGIIDSSGTHFINLRSVLTARDNARQGVSNLLTLRRSLGSATILTAAQSPSTVSFNTANVGFVAHSLGGVVGTTYLGIEDIVTPSSLVNAGGSITQILRESVNFGPPALAGLAAAGVTEAADIAAFFGGAQFIIDSADPVNFANLAAAAHPIHLIKVDGDKRVPNSSTERLAALMSATQIGPGEMNNDLTVPSARIVNFLRGSHTSILEPSAGLDVLTEIHTQLVTHLLSGGVSVNTSADTTLIEAVAP